MKAVIESNRTGTVTIADLPEPALRPGGILVRTEVSVVSAGTERLMVELAQKSLLGKARERPDLVRQVADKARRDGIATTFHAVKTRLDTPVPLGYSSAGVVVAVSPDVDEFKAGDRVACAGAGYASHAEVVFVPRNLAVLLPAQVEGESAAFATLASVALHGLRLTEVSLGETVVVIGLGVVGLLAVQLAAAAGCRVVGFDPQAARAELAAKTGAELTATDNESLQAVVAQLSNGVGADAVLIAAGTPSSEPVALAAELARDRGSVVLTGLVGTDIPRRTFYEKELRLRISRSYGPGRYDPSYEEKGIDYPIGFARWTENRNMQAFVQQVAAGRVSTDVLVTHRFPIHEATKAYELILDGSEPSLGVLITYPGGTALANDTAGPNSTSSSSLDTGKVSTPVVKPKPAAKAAPRAQRRGLTEVGVGVIGAGAFATETLLPAMATLPGVRLGGVCAAGGLSSEQARSKFGFSYATTDAQQILTDDTVDLVLIATRHDLHAPQVIAALEAGKNIFVEKPLCISASELDEVTSAYRTAEGSGAAPFLLVGYNRRFAPMVRRLQTFVSRSAEPLLMTYRVNAGFIPPEHWVQDASEGGGRLIGEVCHFVDTLLYLAGAEPVRVFTTGLPGGGRYRDDNLSMTLEFANGSVGTIIYAANGSKSYPKERLEVYTGGLTAVVDNFRRLDLSSGRRKVIRGSLKGQDKGHQAELAAVTECLLAGRPSPISFDDLVATSLTTFVAVESLRAGTPMAIRLPTEKL